MFCPRDFCHEPNHWILYLFDSAPQSCACRGGNTTIGASSEVNKRHGASTPSHQVPWSKGHTPVTEPPTSNRDRGDVFFFPPFYLEPRRLLQSVIFFAIFFFTPHPAPLTKEDHDYPLFSRAHCSTCWEECVFPFILYFHRDFYHVGVFFRSEYETPTPKSLTSRIRLGSRLPLYKISRCYSFL